MSAKTKGAATHREATTGRKPRPKQKARAQRVPVSVGLGDDDSVRQCINDALDAGDGEADDIQILTSGFDGFSLPTGRAEADALLARDALAEILQGCIESCGDVAQRGRVYKLGSSICTAVFDEAAFGGDGDVVFKAPDRWVDCTEAKLLTPSRRVVFSPGTRTVQRGKAAADELEDFAVALGLGSLEELYELSWDDIKADVEALTIGARVALRRKIGATPVVNVRSEPARSADDPQKMIQELRGELESLKKTEKKEVAAEQDVDTRAKNLRARMRLLRQNPAEVYDDCLKEFADDEGWPWKGTTRDERLAPELLAEVYQSGKMALGWGDDWFSKRGLYGTTEHEEVSLVLCAVDHLLLHDRVNVCNSSAVEVLMRRVAGRMRQLANVRNAGELKNARRHLLEYYDLVRFDGVRATAAEKAARQEMRDDAELAKWGSKTEPGQLSAGGRP